MSAAERSENMVNLTSASIQRTTAFLLLVYLVETKRLYISHPPDFQARHRR